MRHGLQPADRTAATALFLGGGYVSRGPRGSVNSSEVCMLRERHSGSRRGRSRGTPPNPTERGHTGRTAVHPLFCRREAGNFCLGRICFLSQFSSVFLFFIFSSQKCPQYLCTRERGWRSFRSVSEKMPQISGVLWAIRKNFIGLFCRHRV